MELIINIDHIQVLGNTTTSKISIPELHMVNKAIVEEILDLVQTEFDSRS